MTIPRWATRVTSLSKTLALIIFTTFPILGFVLGTQYQKAIDVPKFYLDTANTKSAQRQASSVVSLTGIVRKITPPAPDGFYYELELDKPYNSLTRIPLISVDNNVNSQVMDKVGVKITLSGTIEKKGDQTRYFFVEKINLL